MKRIILILACAMLPMLSFAQDQQTATAENTVQNEMDSLLPEEETLDDMMMSIDSIPYRMYHEIAYPDNIFEEIQGMCERDTPMGILIMILGAVALLAVFLMLITVTVKATVYLYCNRKKN